MSKRLPRPAPIAIDDYLDSEPYYRRRPCLISFVSCFV